MSSIQTNVVTDQTRNRGRPHGRRRCPIQAESLIKINSDFGQIVRESNIKNGQFVNFDHRTTQITLLDAHNAIINYLRDVLPTKVPGCLNTDTGLYRLCDTLQRMFKNTHFNPKNAALKWRLIMENVTHHSGVPFVGSRTPNAPSNSRIPQALPVPTASPAIQTAQPTQTAQPAASEYEPAPVNIDRQRNIENLRRKRLRTEFQKFDQAVTKPGTAPENPQETDIDNCQWNYPAVSPNTDPSESDSKKARLEPDQTCVICMENRRTHAFLHTGLSQTDVTAHFVACQSCANSCYWAEKGCPCCRTPVINIIRIIK